MLWEKRKGCGPYEMPGGFGIVAFKEVLPRKVFYILLDLSFWDILLNIRHSYSLNFLSLCEQASGRIVILYLCFLLESPGPLSTPQPHPTPTHNSDDLMGRVNPGVDGIYKLPR